MKLYEVKKNTKINIWWIDFIFRWIDWAYAKWDDWAIGYSPNIEVIVEDWVYYIKDYIKS